VLTRRTSLRGLALQTGSPAAGVMVHADGSVVVRWANAAMKELLGLDEAASGHTLLADVLCDDSTARLASVARDVVRVQGQRASVAVTVPGPGEPEPLWLHLLAEPAAGFRRLVGATGTPAVLHAERAPRPGPAGMPDAPESTAQLSERLGAALLRLRRRPARVAVAVARVRLPGADGPEPPSALDAADLAERVRQAARETDVVVQLDGGRLAVVAEDSADDGGIVMARRLLAVLHRPLADGLRPVVSVAVAEISDPDADPDAVLAHVISGAAARATGGGLTVLAPWDRGREGPGAPAPVGRTAEASAQIRAALDSGRFVLSCRPVQVPRTGPAAGSRPAVVPGTPVPATLVEVGTVDAGVTSPVRVDSPGLAVELDRWALTQVASLDADEDVVVLRLQPGGALVSLREEVAAVQRHRPGTRLVLGVPEARLDEAVSAQRAALSELPALGVALGVVDWTGRLDVRTLVHWRIGIVELSTEWHRDVLLPEGAAMISGLVAGLRAGLGDAALVLTDRPRDVPAAATLADCGVRWSVPARPSVLGAA
jgi:hypothetical protein